MVEKRRSEKRTAPYKGNVDPVWVLDVDAELFLASGLSDSLLT